MDSWEYSYVRREILDLTGVDLSHYKIAQMQRRLAAYLARSGHANWNAFFRAVRDDPGQIARLKEYLTINVSSFFRDPNKYQYLQSFILPELLHSRATLRVWSAGCARGQEPYSLAMLLSEGGDASRRHQILATDIDHSALAFARAGGPYSREDVANVPPELLSRYFAVRDGHYWVADRLRQKVAFRQQDLLATSFEAGFDLIVCRNVVIYFTTEVKDQLYRRFAEALRPGGVLFVGGTEVVSKASEIGLEPVGISFYRRSARRSGTL